MRLVLSLLVLVLASLSASPSASWAAEPIPVPTPIFFARGSTSGTTGGHVLRGDRMLYSLKASAGQTLTVTLTTPDDNAVFQVYEPDTAIGRDADGLLQFKGKPLHGAGDGQDATRWHGAVPRTGIYLIVVGSSRGNARFSMDVKLE
jgi:hypothetical protein